jgi:hypothetical protein
LIGGKDCRDGLEGWIGGMGGLKGWIGRLDWRDKLKGWIEGMDWMDGLEGWIGGTAWRDGFEGWIGRMDWGDGQKIGQRAGQIKGWRDVVLLHLFIFEKSEIFVFSSKIHFREKRNFRIFVGHFREKRK